MKIVQSRKFVGEPAVEVCCVGEELLKKIWENPNKNFMTILSRYVRAVSHTRVHRSTRPNYSMNVQGGHRFPALAEELFANDGCWERIHFLQGCSPCDATPCSSRYSYLHTHMDRTKWARWVLEKESTCNWEGVMVGWKGQKLKGREWRV